VLCCVRSKHSRNAPYEITWQNVTLKHSRNAPYEITWQNVTLKHSRNAPYEITWQNVTFNTVVTLRTKSTKSTGKTWRYNSRNAPYEITWQTMEGGGKRLNIWFQFAFDTRLITVLARQLLVQSSSSSKRVMNQTRFDVPDPLVVLLSLYKMSFASLILGILSVTDPCLLRVQNKMIPLSLIYCGRLVLADAWLCTDIIQCCSVTSKQLCAFFPFPGFLVGATSLALQLQYLNFYTLYIHTQPSSRTFWLMDSIVTISTIELKA